MDLLKVTEDDKRKVRESYKTDENRIRQDIAIIKEWYKKQPHLPQGIDDETLIEHVLVGSKFRVEVTKDKLDNYYSVKTAYKELFNGYEKLVPTKTYAFFMPLPILTPTQERIIYIKLRDSNSNPLNFEQFIKLILAMGEIMLHFDYAKGIRAIADFQGVKLEHIAKVNSSLLQKVVAASQDALSCRILGIECFNAPGYINMLLSILKRVMKPKIFNRIRLHDSLESLYPIIPKECLPENLGGPLESCEKILEKWDEEYKNKSKFFSEVVTRCSNEKLRIGKSKYVNDAFGVEGSFRKLDLD